MNIYRERLLDHYQNPRNMGKLDNTNLTATNENISCGDNITVYLKVKNKIIVDIKYEVEGCAVCIASASLLSEYIIGKSVTDIKNLSIEQMIDLIGIEITPSRIKCASLSLMSVKSALQKST